MKKNFNSILIAFVKFVYVLTTTKEERRRIAKANRPMPFKNKKQSQ